VEEINIAMVGYYNTLPFLYGLKSSKSFNLILDIPSRCMDYYSSGQVDIALVPVATLLDRSDYEIITDYCIGCEGSVRTVCLFTNSDVNNISKIYLDRDSRTSQLLTKILCERLWNINPDFEECDVRNIDAIEMKSDEGVLMIGDKVFDREDSFKYCYDLGVEWKKLTGLPFAFAVWIARKNTPPSVIERLNSELGLGVNNIEAVLDQNKTLATKIDLSEYFSEYIDFQFNDQKKSAFEYFFEYSKTIQNKVFH